MTRRVILSGIDIDNASTKVELEKLILSNLPGTIKTLMLHNKRIEHLTPSFVGVRPHARRSDI